MKGGLYMILEDCAVFLVASIAAFYASKTSAIYMIDKIKSNTKYYPKKYIKTPRWIKKFFGITRYSIPKYLCVVLCFSAAYLALCPIYILICVLSCSNRIVLRALLFFHIILIIIENNIYIIMSCLFQKRRGNL